MDNFDKQEKKIKEQLDQIEMLPFEERFAEIEPRLDMSESYIKRKSSHLKRMLAAAASIVLLAVVALVSYFSLNNGDKTLRYADDDIKIETCLLEELILTEGLYLPNISLLNINAIEVGRHIETKENIFFILDTIYDDDLSFREIKITIILKKEYDGKLSNDYKNLSEKTSISEQKTISYSPPTFEEPFYSYYVSYSHSEIRYFFQYKSIEEDDLVSFFGKFLT